jgi:hypothetical protein
LGHGHSSRPRCFATKTARPVVAQQVRRPFRSSRTSRAGRGSA